VRTSFSFSSEAGASFECRLDSSQEADFQPCGSPKSYGSLTDGSHTFEVRATDSAGNTYQLAVPTATGSGISQAIYYAPNIKAAAAGTNTVTATFDAPTLYVDLRALEYSGLDPVNPFDVGASASGTGTSATSGAVKPPND